MHLNDIELIYFFVFTLFFIDFCFDKIFLLYTFYPSGTFYLGTKCLGTFFRWYFDINIYFN